MHLSKQESTITLPPQPFAHGGGSSWRPPGSSSQGTSYKHSGVPPSPSAYSPSYRGGGAAGYEPYEPSQVGSYYEPSPYGGGSSDYQYLSSSGQSQRQQREQQPRQAGRTRSQSHSQRAGGPGGDAHPAPPLAPLPPRASALQDQHAHQRSHSFSSTHRPRPSLSQEPSHILSPRHGPGDDWPHAARRPSYLDRGERDRERENPYTPSHQEFVPAPTPPVPDLFPYGAGGDKHRSSSRRFKREQTPLRSNDYGGFVSYTAGTPPYEDNVPPLAPAPPSRPDSVDTGELKNQRRTERRERRAREERERQANIEPATSFEQPRTRSEKKDKRTRPEHDLYSQAESYSQADPNPYTYPTASSGGAAYPAYAPYDGGHPFSPAHPPPTSQASFRSPTYPFHSEPAYTAEPEPLFGFTPSHAHFAPAYAPTPPPLSPPPQSIKRESRKSSSKAKASTSGSYGASDDPLTSWAGGSIGTRPRKESSGRRKSVNTRDTDDASYFDSQHARSASGSKKYGSSYEAPLEEPLSTSAGRHGSHRKESRRSKTEPEREHEGLSDLDPEATRLVTLPPTPLEISSPEVNRRRSPSPKQHHSSSRSYNPDEYENLRASSNSRTSQGSRRTKSKTSDPIAIPSTALAKRSRSKKKKGLESVREAEAEDIVVSTSLGDEIIDVGEFGTTKQKKHLRHGSQGSRTRRYSNSSHSGSYSHSTHSGSYAHSGTSAQSRSEESESITQSETEGERAHFGSLHDSDADVLKPSSISRRKKRSSRAKEDKEPVLAIAWDENDAKEKDLSDTESRTSRRRRSRRRHRKRGSRNPSPAERSDKEVLEPASPAADTSQEKANEISPPVKEVEDVKTGITEEWTSSLPKVIKHSASPSGSISHKSRGRRSPSKGSTRSSGSSQGDHERFYSPHSEHSRGKSLSPAPHPDSLNLPTSVSRPPSSVGTSPHRELSPSPPQSPAKSAASLGKPSTRGSHHTTSASASASSAAASESEGEIIKNSQSQPLTIPGSAPRSRTTTPSRSRITTPSRSRAPTPARSRQPTPLSHLKAHHTDGRASSVTRGFSPSPLQTESQSSPPTSSTKKVVEAVATGTGLVAVGKALVDSFSSSKEAEAATDREAPEKQHEEDKQKSEEEEESSSGSEEEESESEEDSEEEKTQREAEVAAKALLRKADDPVASPNKEATSPETGKDTETSKDAEVKHTEEKIPLKASASTSESSEDSSSGSDETSSEHSDTEDLEKAKEEIPHVQSGEALPDTTSNSRDIPSSENKPSAEKKEDLHNAATNKEAPGLTSESSSGTESSSDSDSSSGKKSAKAKTSTGSRSPSTRAKSPLPIEPSQRKEKPSLTVNTNSQEVASEPENIDSDGSGSTEDSSSDSDNEMPPSEKGKSSKLTKEKPGVTSIVTNVGRRRDHNSPSASPIQRRPSEVAMNSPIPKYSETNLRGYSSPIEVDPRQTRDAEGDMDMENEGYDRKADYEAPEKPRPVSPVCSCDDCEFKTGCPKCHYHPSDGSFVSNMDGSGGSKDDPKYKNTVMFNDMKDYHESYKRYKRDLDDLHNEYNGLQRERDKLGKKLEKLDKAYEKKDRELIELKKDYEELRTHSVESNTQHDAELKRAIANRDRDWDQTWKDKNSHLIKNLEDARTQRHQLEKSLSEKEMDIRDLELQIKRLKHDISLSTRSEPQKTDDLFNQDFGDLWRNLQQWVFLNFKGKIAYDSLPEHTKKTLSDVTGGKPELVVTKRYFVVSALISQQLVESVFNSYMFGMTKETNQGLSTLELYLASLSDDPAYEGAMNQWRANTLGMIRKHAIGKSVGGPQPAATDMNALIEDLLLHLIAALTPLGLSSAAEPREKLRAMLETTVSLSIELRVQRARFTVEPPNMLLGEPMDSDKMEDLDGGEEEDWKDRKVGCVAWSAVWKTGDENGENTHLKNLIFKAQVVLVN